MATKIGRLISSCSNIVSISNNRSFSAAFHRVHSFERTNQLHWVKFHQIRMSSTTSPSESASVIMEPVQNLETIQLETGKDSLDNKNGESGVTAEVTSKPSSDSIGESTAAETPEKRVRVPKIKAAILLSYSGQGYFGSQIQNSGARTIENDLLKALLDAKQIDEEGFQKPKSIRFQRAARTDKNVSAARNVISVMVPKTFDMEAVNKCLPDQIRIMDFRRVTKHFDAKIACSSRTYLYMTPTFAFAPLEEKVQEDYRITPEVLERVREVLKLYIGTKNYHNFTSRKKPTDPSNHRYIMSFDTSEPFVKDGLEYVVLKVKGQSFMMHQIRKMIGLAVAILRGFTNEDTVAKAFTLEKVDIPMVPGLGLMLGEAHYDRYNNKFGKDGFHEPLIWDSVADKVEQFCQDKIYCNVTKTENEEKSMLQWLSTIPFHTFDPREFDAAAEGYGPLGKAHLLAKMERGEDIEDEFDEEGDESEDECDQVPRKKQRSS